MHVIVLGCRDDLIGSKADAFVIDLHPAIAGAEGDLFCTVGMAV